MFIISPDSVQSEYCEREVDFATDNNKRIITINLRAAETKDIPEALRLINWIDFKETPFDEEGNKVGAEAYAIVDFDYDADLQILRLKTQLDDIIEVDKKHTLEVSVKEEGEPYPVVHFRSNLFGLLNRNIFYDLIELGEHVTEGDSTYCYITSNGERFLLGSYEI